MITADRLTTAIRERLEEFDIAFDIVASGDTREDTDLDAVAILSHAGVVARYAVVAKSPVTLSSVSRARTTPSPYPLLIIGDRIGRRSATALREAGLQFVDALGNAFITFDGIVIEVQGRTESATRSAESSKRTPQPTNIFSPRRSQVILALLAWPELSSAKVRAVAGAAGVSTGQAHDALAQLEHAGYVTPGSRRLSRAEELLDYWTAAYPAGLSRQLELARYHGDPSRSIDGAGPGQAVYLSSESAEETEIARPATLTVYLTTLDPRLPVVNRWSSSPERAANIFVRRKFWTSPRPDEEELRTARARNAPWPLVYADLMATGDARLREVAAAWRSRHARPDEV